MIDIHCHVLPGLDDGPKDIVETVDICRAARDSGTDTLVATSHVDWKYDQVDAGRIAAAVDQVRAALQGAGVEMTILRGAEVALSKANELSDETLAALTLGGGPSLLIEPPEGTGGYERALAKLALRGFGIVIAHPERSSYLRHHPDVLRGLTKAGVVCCVTAVSLTGTSGRHAEAFAWHLLEERFPVVISSDGHGLLHRKLELGKQLVAAGFDTHAIQHFASHMPAAILAGERPPAPIAVARRRRWMLGRQLRRRLLTT